jgi:hypothetical protein
MRRAAFTRQPVWRVVPTRHPPISVFERAARPEDIEDNLRLEMAFSPHHGEAMRILALPREEWATGPGSGFIMAPFVYPSPSRFTDGSFGVFYAGLEERTAIEEVAWHRARFMAQTGQGPMGLAHHVLRASVSGDLADLREPEEGRDALLDPDPDRYPAAQAWARARRGEGLDGIAYPSVRRAGGQCAAVFRPQVVQACRIMKLMNYLWDGARIVGVSA